MRIMRLLLLAMNQNTSMKEGLRHADLHDVWEIFDGCDQEGFTGTNEEGGQDHQ
jgi:hypothetical protein